MQTFFVLDFDGVLFNSAFEAYSVANKATKGKAEYRQRISYEEFLVFRGVVTDAWHYNRLYHREHAVPLDEVRRLKPIEADWAFAKDFFEARRVMMEDPQWPKVMSPYDFFFLMRPLLLKSPDRFAILSTRNLKSIHETLTFHGIDNVQVFGQEDIRRLGSKYAIALDQHWLLVGGGVDLATVDRLRERISSLGVPVMTTYNGADRFDGDAANYLGRPNTWGQRSSNIIIQQSDLIIAVGTRLGLQQTGFNWREFGRDAHIVQVEIDAGELAKGHPRIDTGLLADANDFLERLVAHDLPAKTDWLAHARHVRRRVPRIEDVNQTGQGFLSPYEFIVGLESLTRPDDLIIPCSSGSAFTLSMQLYKQKLGQRVLTNKSLASMGYGLSGAIGAAMAGAPRRTILIEGDGGFAQNMQELGTVSINRLNLKMFIFDDQGHASIRMTQRSYFGGKYLGCDARSGLGLPRWEKLFAAWDLPVMRLPLDFTNDAEVQARLADNAPCAFIVPIDPEQTYFPKISSRITASGSMESNPIDRMTPEIDYLAEADVEA